MTKTLIVFFALLCVTACAGRNRAPGGVIVDMKGVDRTQYQADLAECGTYADQVKVGEKAVVGAAAGAVVGGLIGAAVGDSGTAGRSAGAGAVVGGAKGTGRGINEREQVVKNCLRNRGYSVLN